MLRRSLLVSVVGLLGLLSGLSPSRAQDKPGPEEKKTATPSTGERQLLESIGALAAGQLYQTYLNIGLLADAVSEGTYEEDDARQVLQTAVGLLDLQDKHLARVAKLNLTQRDREALTKLRKISTALHQQAEALDASWKSEDKEHSSRYERARQEAWTGLSRVLGLKK